MSAEAAATPENWPTPLPELGEREIPTAAHFRRDHFPPPLLTEAAWALEVRGAVRHPFRLTLDELRALASRSLSAVLECAGHRRSEYRPVVPGVPWGVGAIAEASYTGVPLHVVLERAGVLDGAVEVVLVGADRGPFEGVEGSVPFARSIPLEKALHPDTLLAWEMNGAPLPRGHGGPVRALVPGWYATDSVKWLVAVEVATEPFEGPFQALDYRFRPAGDPTLGRRMDALPVHALFTAPSPDTPVPAGEIELRGIAWGGRGGVARVAVQVDGGEWRDAELEPPASAYGRAFWRLACGLAAGEHEVAVRATDASGTSQPDEARWNHGGYLNNAVHRIRIHVRDA